MDVTQIGRGPKVEMDPIFGSVQTMCDYMTAQHKEYFAHADAEADDQYRPMLFAVCENGEIVPILTDFQSDEQKDFFCAQMAVAFKLWRVVRYAFAMEAWFTDNVTEENKHIAPSQRDDRKEMIFTSVIDKDGSTAFSSLEMIRDWTTGKVTELRDTTDRFKGTDFGGRFANLLGNKPMPEFFT